MRAALLTARRSVRYLRDRRCGSDPTRSACALSSKRSRDIRRSLLRARDRVAAHRRQVVQLQKRHVYLVGRPDPFLGTQVNGVPASANNEGAQLLHLTATRGLATVYASAGRFHLGLSIVKLSARGHSNGTFKGREPLGATRRFTGSYRC